MHGPLKSKKKCIFTFFLKKTFSIFYFISCAATYNTLRLKRLIKSGEIRVENSPNEMHTFQRPCQRGRIIVFYSRQGTVNFFFKFTQSNIISVRACTRCVAVDLIFVREHSNENVLKVLMRKRDRTAEREGWWRKLFTNVEKKYTKKHPPFYIRNVSDEPKRGHWRDPPPSTQQY